MQNRVACYQYTGIKQLAKMCTFSALMKSMIRITQITGKDTTAEKYKINYNIENKIQIQKQNDKL